jgi:hypothetical protein
MRLTEKQGAAIFAIIFGLFLLLNGPTWVVTHAIAREDPEFAQKIAAIDARDTTLTIAGGVLLTIGALIGWRAWAKPS